MADEDDGMEEEFSFQSMPEKHEVVDRTDYGLGRYLRDTRDASALMAASTRLDDRVIEIKLHRSGDWVYRSFKVQFPVVRLLDGGERSSRSFQDDLDTSEGSKVLKILPELLSQDELTLVPKPGKPGYEETPKQRMLLCPLQKTMIQQTRLPSHTVLKWRCTARVDRYLKLQERNPDYLVPYPMVGFRDRRTDAAARRAYRLRLPGPGDKEFKPDLAAHERLPKSLIRVEKDDKWDDEEELGFEIKYRSHLEFVTAIKNLDLRALTLLAHFDEFMESLTMEQVWENLMDTILLHRNDLLFRGIDPVKLRDPENWDEASDDIFRLLMGRMDGITGKYYDWWYPSEQYRWREHLSDELERQPDTVEGKALGNQALADLTAHVLVPPKTSVEYKPSWLEQNLAKRIEEMVSKQREADNRGDVKERDELEKKLDAARREYRRINLSGSWDVKVDWDPFRVFGEYIENWRDWPRMLGHYKMTKFMRNSLDSGDITDSDTKRARQNDHGGFRNPQRYGSDWRFRILWDWAEAEAPMPKRPADHLLERQLGDPSDPDSQDESDDEWRIRMGDLLADYNREFDKGDPRNQIEFQGRTMLREDARRHILGYAWFSVLPESDMAHDGTLMSIFNEKRVNWVEMIRKLVRAQNSNAGTGVMPSYDKLLEEVLSRARNYESEDAWTDVDEYCQRDPVDVWLHQNGIISFTQMNEASVRLAGPYRKEALVRLTYDNCTALKDFIRRMWNLQPVEPVRERLEHSIAEDEANRVTDTLQRVVKITSGLPDVRVISRMTGNQPLFLPASEMEDLICYLRRRGVDWMENRAAELDYIGSARVFTGQTFGGWVSKNGFPFRIGDDDASLAIYQNLGHQSWVTGIFDTRIGIGETSDDFFLTPEEQIKLRRSTVLSRKQNIHYASERPTGKYTRKEHIKWVSEWITGAGVLSMSEERDQKLVENLAEAIVDHKSYEEVMDIVPSDLERRLDLERKIWQVYWTYHHRPLNV